MADRSKSSELTIDYQVVHLSVTWETVLFPFEQWKLVRVLPELGYSVAQDVARQLPLGARAQSTGPIAAKGRTGLILNSERQQIIIDATDPSSAIGDAIEELGTVEEALASRLRFNSKAMARNYEIDAQLLIWSGKSPLKVFGDYWSKASNFKSFEELTGQPCSNHSLHLFTPGKTPLNTDWFDIRLEPSNTDACYFCIVVYRHPNRDNVLEFTSRIPTMIPDIVKKLETES